MVRLLALLLVAGAAFVFPGTTWAEGVAISDSQALVAGKKLWQNECGGTVAGLTSWNGGEDFASLGIGHYIWYPAGHRGPFEESFPELVRFLSAHQVTLPDWLAQAPACPWSSREEFMRDLPNPRLASLRELLARTVGLQARFSADRLQAALPKMLNDAPPDQRTKIRREFDRVAASPNGVYALVDYVNFKGEGTLPSERYQGQGWGLLQVLAGMPNNGDTAPGPAAVREFADSAAKVLTQRVANAPAQRGEARWLPGWKNRVRTYSAD